MHILDYAIFIIAVCSWLVIGVIIGVCKRKSQLTTIKQYFYGDGQFSALSIGLSLYSSGFSTAIVISLPAEIYSYGGGYLLSGLHIFIALPIICFIVTPIFCGSIKMETPYEYFELRFGKSIRIIAFSIQALYSILKMPIIMYGTMLILSELSGVNLALCTSVIGGITVMYTLIGGFPSVIWTDVIQTILMCISYIVLLVMGVWKSGSVAEVWRRAEEGGRLNILNLNPSPFERMSIWTCLIGLAFSHASYRICAISSLQRILACSTLKQAQISVTIATFGYTISKIVLCLIGFTMYANYYNCDPVQNKEVSNANNLLPKFALEIFENVPGFTGIFATGIVSAGLSTISSELNGVAVIIYYDIMKQLFKSSSIEKYGKTIIMVTVSLLGCIIIAVAPTLDNSRSLIEITITLGGILYGAQLGLLLLGIMLPWANLKGALVGVITSVCLTTWISFGSLYYNINVDKLLPTSIDNCPNSTLINYTNTTENIDRIKLLSEYRQFTNMTESISTTSDDDNDPFVLYRLSFAYYSFINCFMLIVVGMLVSYVTGFNDIRNMDDRLIFSGWRKFIKPNNKEALTH